MVFASKLVLPKEVMVTRRSITEYAQALRPRYAKAAKEEKSKILDEFVKVIGYHCKAAIHLLRRGNQFRANRRC